MLIENIENIEDVETLAYACLIHLKDGTVLEISSKDGSELDYSAWR